MYVRSLTDDSITIISCPTRKKLDLRFCEVPTLKNGKVMDVRAYFDPGTMMRQLGVVPESVGSK